MYSADAHAENNVAGFHATDLQIHRHRSNHYKRQLVLTDLYI